MRCPKCGYDNPNDANFCIACGEKLEKQDNDIKICPACGAKNYNDSVFCTVCGKMFEDKKQATPEDFGIEKIEKMSPLNKACLIISIIGASITFIAFQEVIAIIGLTIATVAIVMLAIGIIAKKISGKIKYTIALSLFGIIGNMSWLAFLIWMLPNF